VSIIKAFYDANDAAAFEKSLAYLSEDVTLSSHAEGVNGHRMMEKELAGKDQVRTALGDSGLRHSSTRPDGPVYHEQELKASGDTVTFKLQPDRTHPNGRPYNPYKVEIIFAGCKIKSLTVVELVTWL
jgi:hypothetical protein